MVSTSLTLYTLYDAYISCAYFRLFPSQIVARCVWLRNSRATRSSSSCGSNTLISISLSIERSKSCDRVHRREIIGHTIDTTIILTASIAKVALGLQLESLSQPSHGNQCVPTCKCALRIHAHSSVYRLRVIAERSARETRRYRARPRNAPLVRSRALSISPLSPESLPDVSVTLLLPVVSQPVSRRNGATR